MLRRQLDRAIRNEGQKPANAYVLRRNLLDFYLGVPKPQENDPYAYLDAGVSCRPKWVDVRMTYLQFISNFKAMTHPRILDKELEDEKYLFQERYHRETQVFKLRAYAGKVQPFLEDLPQPEELEKMSEYERCRLILKQDITALVKARRHWRTLAFSEDRKVQDAYWGPMLTFFRNQLTKVKNASTFVEKPWSQRQAMARRAKKMAEQAKAAAMNAGESLNADGMKEMGAKAMDAFKAGPTKAQKDFVEKQRTMVTATFDHFSKLFQAFIIGIVEGFNFGKSEEEKKGPYDPEELVNAVKGVKENIVSRMPDVSKKS